MTAPPADPPVIDCAPLPLFDAADLADVRRAFTRATPVVLHQTWLAGPETAFAPAGVRTGWREGALLVFAELSDQDIFTTATDHNQPFWELGDTFEMFLRPVEQAAYVECHVAPTNLRLHLRFPDAGWLARTPPAEVFGHALGSPDAFESHTWVHADRQQWCVLAVIPAATVREHPRPLAGAEWCFSFSRYDYTRGRKDPVISSTSPHPVPSFHRQQEWGLIRFQP